MKHLIIILCFTFPFVRLCAQDISVDQDEINEDNASIAEQNKNQIGAKKVASISTVGYAYVRDGDTMCYLYDYFRFDQQARIVMENGRVSDQNPYLETWQYNSKGQPLFYKSFAGNTVKAVPIKDAKQITAINRDSLAKKYYLNARTTYRNGKPDSAFVYQFGKVSGIDIYTYDENDSLINIRKFIDGKHFQTLSYRSSGKIISDSTFYTGSTHVHLFDEHGMEYLDEIIRNGKIMIESKWIMKYDTQGRMLEYAETDSNDVMLWKKVMEYDDSGNITNHMEYGPNGGLRSSYIQTTTKSRNGTTITIELINVNSRTGKTQYSTDVEQISADSLKTEISKTIYYKDSLGNVTGRQTSNSVYQRKKVIDDRGNYVIKSQSHDGIMEYCYTWKYDSLNRLVEYSSLTEGKIQYEYFSNGRVHYILKTSRDGSYIRKEYSPEGILLVKTWVNKEGVETKKVVNTLTNGLITKTEFYTDGKLIEYRIHTYTFYH